MATLHCSVVTPERAILEMEADKVTLPAWDGEVGILPRHAPFLARLGVGVLKITHDGVTEERLVEGGFVQVADDHVTILTDSAVELPDIDVTEAKARVESLRNSGRGPELAEALHRLMTMQRVKDQFNRS